MKIKFFQFIALLLSSGVAFSQDCKTTVDLETMPGKYLTAAQYPWPAVKADYFKNMKTAADKTIAKQTLGKLENTEHQSHSNFELNGGNWENYYSSEGYNYFGNTQLAQYTFQAAYYEFFCSKGKAVRNTEFSSVLRMYVNKIQLNTLDKFLINPFGNSMRGDYNFGIQFMDWKNQKPIDVNAKLINLFTYLSCNNPSLIESINTGKNYFQDVAEKDIKPNNRTNHVYRYWFIKKKDIPVLVPVSRKEYLQSLLEYYEREKIHFAKTVVRLKEDNSAGIKYYSAWEQDVADKIAVVQKALNEQDEKWLSAQAVINVLADKSQNYKAKLTEQTNINRFWRFYDNENKSEPLYKYNPDYFKTDKQGAAKPQLIAIAFRFVSLPSSIKLLNNFTKNFDFEGLKKMVE